MTICNLLVYNHNSQSHNNHDHDSQSHIDHDHNIQSLTIIMIVPQSGKVATVRWNPPTVGSHSGFKLKVIFLFSFDENQIGKRSSEGILPYGKCWAEG